jgi:peroxiredoxin
MRSDIRPGGVFPDYSLPDHTGTVRTLSELQERDSLILALARGNYCPKEHQQHPELAANQSKIAVGCCAVSRAAGRTQSSRSRICWTWLPISVISCSRRAPRCRNRAKVSSTGSGS